MQKDKIGVKLSLSYEEAISYLEALLKSLKSKKIVVQNGDEFVSMTPGEQVMIELAAKVKKDKNKFSFEMSWMDALEGELKITDKEPEIKASAVPAKKPDTTPAKKPDATPAKTITAAPAKQESAKKQTAKKPAKKSAAKKPVAKKPVAKKPAAKNVATKTSVTKPGTIDAEEKKPPVKPTGENANPAVEEKATPKTTAVKPKSDPLTKPTTTGTKP